MDKANTSFIVSLLFILRCLVPFAILFGISYLLKRLGYIKTTPTPPSDTYNEKDNSSQQNSDEGGLAHGSP